MFSGGSQLLSLHFIWFPRKTTRFSPRAPRNIKCPCVDIRATRTHGRQTTMIILPELPTGNLCGQKTFDYYSCLVFFLFCFYVLPVFHFHGFRRFAGRRRRSGGKIPIVSVDNITIIVICFSTIVFYTTCTQANIANTRCVKKSTRIFQLDVQIVQ